MSSESDIPDRDDMERIYQEFPEVNRTQLLLAEILEALRLIELVLIETNDKVAALLEKRS